MLRITTEKSQGRVTLTVEGKLAGPWVEALQQSWKELRNSASDENLSVNLCGVIFIDAAGKALLKEIHKQGGRLVAVGCLNQAIVREIATEATGEGSEKQTAERKRNPIIFYVLFAGLTLASGGPLRAQTDRRNGLPPNVPTETLRLTLDQAVALALKQNTTAQIAVIQAAEAVQDKNVARAA